MDLQEILAELLNPNGPQQAQPAGMTAPVGDHAGAVQQRLGGMPPQMAQQAPQQAPQPQPMPPQAPQSQPMPQPAPQAPQQPLGGGLGAIGGILQKIIAPQSAQKNVTVGWLTKQGMDPGFATVLASDKTALRSYILSKSQGKASEFDQRAQAAQQYGLDPSTPEGRDFVLTGNLPQARGGNAELGLNPQYGVDDQGNPVLLQLGKDGKVVKSALPEGVSLSKEPIKVDLGTSWGLIDPITRQVIGSVPKDLAGEASQKKLGEAQAAASFDLPRIEQNAQQTLDVIEQLKTHPGREAATGLSARLDPRNYIAGTDATNFKVLLDQVKGQTFLQAFQSLKGGGQITEVEGAKATDAIARLNTAQSEDEFMKALDDFEGVIRAGLNRAKQQAGTPSGYTPGAPAAVTPGGQRVMQQMTNPKPMGGGDGWQDLGNGVRVRKVN